MNRIRGRIHIWNRKKAPIIGDPEDPKWLLLVPFRKVSIEV